MMPSLTSKRGACLTVLTLAMIPLSALADDPIGQIKTETGMVTLERHGMSLPVAVGDHVFQSDIVVTQTGSVGITFADNSMMSLGPNSRLALDQFRFDTTTHNGVFDSTLQKGTLAVKSGQIVRQRPEAMHIRTPAALLGVRGTQFVVRADAKG
jgi:hypothetical protein